jgi:3,4-dihydroxy 2-butanone 4-phosphate synthase/GTP cyclohydrolase II
MASARPLHSHSVLSSGEEIVGEAQGGRMFLLVDDEESETEGNLVIPAQMATPDAITFMATHGRGLICLALAQARVEQLGLPLMSPGNDTRRETAFTVSIEARDGVTTGISAADRARTIAVAIDAGKGPEQIVSPGHVFPLVARPGGVLERAGHTEAAVDIARLAGLTAAGVICRILKDDGTMARLDDLVAFAQRHGLKIAAIRDLIAYRRRHDHLVEKRAETIFQSRWGGEWRIISYANKANGAETVALIKGVIDPAAIVPVRMHVHSPFVDLFAEEDPGAGLLERSMQRVAELGAGIVVVLRSPAPDLTACVIRARREGREKSAGERVALREYGIGAQILADLGVHRALLLTNSANSFVGIEGYGLEIVGTERLS